MAHRFNWAMEKMGWRMPDEVDELGDVDFETAEIHEYPFAGNEVSRDHSVTVIDDLESQPVPAAFSASEGKRNVQNDRHRIITVHPRSYADALAVGESFRDGVPVIMNLTDMDDAEARRIIDFAAGLTFGLRGAIERVTTRVFLLSPNDIEVSHERSVSRSDLY